MSGIETIRARLNRVGGIVRQEILTVRAHSSYTYNRARGGLERLGAAP